LTLEKNTAKKETILVFLDDDAHAIPDAHFIHLLKESPPPLNDSCRSRSPSSLQPEKPDSEPRLRILFSGQVHPHGTLNLHRGLLLPNMLLSYALGVKKQTKKQWFNSKEGIKERE